MILTQDILEQGISRNGGWNNKQIRLFGISRENNTGWKLKILGLDFPKSIIDRFLALKDRHLSPEELLF